MAWDVPLLALWAVASSTVTTGLALLVSQKLGSQQTWLPPFFNDSLPCEALDPFSSVLRPVNAMATVAYFLGGILILALAGEDASALITSGLNSPSPVRLLSRLPFWSAAWGLWMVALGAVSFAYFVAGTVEMAHAVTFVWWGMGAHVVSYAWARFTLDRPEVHEIGCQGCVCVVHVMDSWWWDR